MSAGRRRATPRVSIGMPVRNGERFIAEAIDSILRQTFSDFELIVRDNASVDRTQEICRSYAAKDGRVRYIRTETNVGAGGNYNLIVPLAAGAYFKWAAVDDICEPAYLERCAAVLDADPSVVLCHSRMRLIDEDRRDLPYDPRLDRFIDRRGVPRLGPRTVDIARSVDPCERFRDVVLHTPPCFDVFGLIRTDILRKTALHRPYYGSDRGLLVELALYGRFSEVREELFLGREHAGQSIRLGRRDQQTWMDPTRRQSTLFPGRPFHVQCLSSVLRSPLAVEQKARCINFLIGRVSWEKLWKPQSWPPMSPRPG